MTKSKSSFMVAAGASVVIVRDGKRKTIAAGSGTDFTEDEITSINKALPGALRKPVNESAVRAAVEADIEDDDDETEATVADTAKKAPAKKAAAKKAPAKKKAAPVKDDADDEDEDADADADEDADEDEDI